MKKMRKLVWMLLAATMVGFAACSSDDDEDWVETPGGDGGSATGTVDVCGDATPVSEYTFDFQYPLLLSFSVIQSHCCVLSIMELLYKVIVFEYFYELLLIL